MPLYRYLIPALICVISMTAQSQQTTPSWITKVGARTSPANQAAYSVNAFGAMNDGKTVNTTAIQKAIDQAAAKGGGLVTFQPGTYVTGSLFIKSNVQLRIDKGVLLLGSESFADYPEIDTRIAGIEMKWPAALINIIDAKNASITGKGIINARGKFCWDKYWAMRSDYDAKGLRWIVDYDAKRVRTILVQQSSDITIKDITMQNAGFWTVQLLYSDHLTVNGITIRNNLDGHGPSTDGVDVDSSSWVLIENCDIDCNDDNFCLKAGRDWDGLRVNRPTEYVVIRKSLARRGGGLLTLGSETSGGIRHVYASDLRATNTDNGLRIKSATTRGGMLEDIYFGNSVLDSVKNVFSFTLNWYPAYSYTQLPEGYSYDRIPAHWKAMLHKVEPAERGIPHARDFHISDLTITHAQKLFSAAGLPESLLTGFTFNHLAVAAETIGTMTFTQAWQFNDIKINLTQPHPPAKTISKEEKERMQ